MAIDPGNFNINFKTRSIFPEHNIHMSIFCFIYFLNLLGVESWFHYLVGQKFTKTQIKNLSSMEMMIGQILGLSKKFQKYKIRILKPIFQVDIRQIC